MENPPHSPGDTFQPTNNESVTPTSQVTQAPPKKKSKKPLVIVIVLALIIITGLLTWKVLIPNLQFRVATSKANQFIDAIKANDAETAYSQTSPSYQSRISQEQLQKSLDSVVFKNVDKSNIKLVSKKIISSNPQTIEFKYAFGANDKTYFIKLTLIENDGSWQVDQEVLSGNTDGFQRDQTGQ